MTTDSPRGAHPLDSLRRDVRHAILRLTRDWPFALPAVLILAVGIGANTAIFSLVNAALFRPQSYAEPDQLVNVYQNVGDQRTPGAVSFPAYRDIAQQTDVFANVAISFTTEARYRRPDGIRAGLVDFATSSYLSTIGLAPARGRWFNQQEDDAGAAPAAVIGYRNWTDRYGSDPAILGQTVNIGGSQITIVGIAPPEVHNSNVGSIFSDFWLSISAIGPVAGNLLGADVMTRRDNPAFQVKARLRDGVTLDQAQAAMDVLAARLKTDYPDKDPGKGMTILRAKDVRFTPSVDAIAVLAAGALLAIVGLILAIACSNLATLMLVRGSSRAKEISVRLALGATRGQLVRHLLTESLLLAAVGAAGGCLLASWSMRIVSATDFGPAIEVGLDYRVLMYAIGLSIITGTGSGLAPALVSTKTGLAFALREQSATAPTRSWFTLKNALIVAQVAASFLLLMTTGFGVRTIANSAEQDPGYGIAGLAILETDTRFSGYDRARSRMLMQDLVRRIQSINGVASVFATNGMPPGDNFSRILTIDGESQQSVGGGWASPGSFETLRLPILYGRSFTINDRPGAPEVAVVNETFARRYYGSRNAVGRRFGYAGVLGTVSAANQIEVIGVVRDTLEADDLGFTQPRFYLSTVQQDNVPSVIVARTSRNATEIAAQMQEELRKLDVTLPVLTSGTMQSLDDERLKPWKNGVAMLTGLATMGLGLACLGLYAVVAFAVVRRSREVGIRMALGARDPQVVWLMMRDVSVLVGTGILVGSGLSVVVLALLGAFNPATGTVNIAAPATDPITFLAIAALMLGVGFVAAYVPARRAARVDPMESLRA